MLLIIIVFILLLIGGIGTLLFNINKPELKFHNSEIDIKNVSFERRNLLKEEQKNEKY